MTKSTGDSPALWYTIVLGAEEADVNDFGDAQWSTQAFLGLTGVWSQGVVGWSNRHQEQHHRTQNAFLGKSIQTRAGLVSLATP